MDKVTKKMMRNGLPKAQALIASLVVSCAGYFVLRGIADSWLTITNFFAVWILFFLMIHSPHADRPIEKFEYLMLEKGFIDDLDLITYIKDQGMKGWQLVSIKASVSRVET